MMMMMMMMMMMQGVLQRELGMMWEFFNHASVRLPINPSLEVVGVDRKVSLTSLLTINVPLTSWL